MADQITFAEFWQRFVAVERATEAIHQRFKGLQLYPILRVRIFYALTQGLGLFDNPHPSSKNADDKALLPISSFAEFGKAKTVVLPFKRTVAGSDPYSDRILEILRTSGNSLNSNPGEIKILNFDTDIARLRALFAETILEKETKRILHFGSGRDAKRWHTILDAFSNEFGVDLSKLRKYPPLSMRLTLAESKGFAKFFKSLGAQDLYIVNAYSEQAIVLGAKLAGVRVHEIQHGFITAMHPAYSYPHSNGFPFVVANSPDSILTWGEYWTDGVPLPQGTKAIVTGPTKTFSEYRNRVASENRIIKNQILFTSQGAVATQLLTAALNTAIALPQHKVIYRLHPNEDLADYRTLADQLGHRSLPTNFSFSHKDPIFLDLVSQSEYLVGAFSTTLYEGLALGCKVLVLPLPGYEHVQRAIDLGDMTLVSSLDALPEFLAKAKPAADPKRYYA